MNRESNKIALKILKPAIRLIDKNNKPNRAIRRLIFIGKNKVAVEKKKIKKASIKEHTTSISSGEVKIIRKTHAKNDKRPTMNRINLFFIL